MPCVQHIKAHPEAPGSPFLAGDNCICSSGASPDTPKIGEKISRHRRPGHRGRGAVRGHVEDVMHVYRPDVVREPPRDAQLHEPLAVDVPPLGDVEPRARNLGARRKPPVHQEVVKVLTPVLEAPPTSVPAWMVPKKGCAWKVPKKGCAWDRDVWCTCSVVVGPPFWVRTA